MNKRNVKILTGGGGSHSSGAIKEKEALGLKNPCHAELDSASVRCYLIELNRNIQQFSPRRINKLFLCLLLNRHAGQILKQVQDDTRGQAGSLMGLRAAVQRLAFTMAEILLSLTIIGVVAAITLPSLTGNINERTWNTQRKALYARMSQAIALMPSVNQYANAEAFVTTALTSVLKINNICDSEHLFDCGVTSKNITNIGGSALLMPTTLGELNPKNVSMSYDDSSIYGDGHYTPPGDDTPYLGSVYSYSAEDSSAVAFETQNGETLLAFYNPVCTADMQETNYYLGRKICANFIYDLNGSKGPNAVGKDIGIITVFYPTDSVVVAPMPYLRHSGVNTTFNGSSAACTALSEDYRGANVHEMMALIYNEKLAATNNDEYWTTSRYDGRRAWKVSRTTVRTYIAYLQDSTWGVSLCVKR